MRGTVLWGAYEYQESISRVVNMTFALGKAEMSSGTKAVAGAPRTT